MERYLNTPIKEVIAQFPEVGKILEDYHIGCVPCSVGTCLLKDIIEVHRLSEEDEKAVMARISRVIYPGREIEVPKIGRKTGSRVKGLSYSPPVKQLVDEHRLIKRWIALIPDLLERIDVESDEDRQLLLEGVDFIRSYADRFHHAKEEDILFRYFDERQEILKAMLDDHERGRGHARAVAEAVGKKDTQAIIEHLLAYRDLLTQHIKKEDEILYPWMEGGLSMKQVGELFSRFREVDEASGREVTDRSVRFVTKVEEIIRQRKEETR